MIARIRSDHGREFENTKLATFCNDQGTHQEFSSPKTPQQNGIVERKNRVAQEMARVMLHNKKVCPNPSREKQLTLLVIHSIGCISNLIPKRLLMNSGEERSRLFKYFRIFGSDCYILCDRENLEKFDSKSDGGYFLGYSFSSRAYRVI